ncbi:hypothetical protein SAMN04487965_2543 [Microbulbifer donghaiensis]|uniref:Uncharacterized protein n=1 Tax=Microbulbifer donghaiensis TaxID=494016 RepID=A0A1M5DZQ2_9GAMM|nr:hypothetical protein [Microbulbifer donghaiensis]SHF72354.1 hypothetical protein SAMN04487965_2543 [Microbulbifer donghaiensis]
MKRNATLPPGRPAALSMAFIFSHTGLVAAQESTNNQDLVNERLPYSARHMEQMWKVDCAQLITTLLQWPAVSQNGDSATLPHSLSTQLNLCGYIHNDPGRRFFLHCPDYRGAYQLLEAQQFKLSEALLAELTEKLSDCPQTEK